MTRTHARSIVLAGVAALSLGLTPAAAGSSCQAITQAADAACELSLAGASMGIDGTATFSQDVTDARVRVTMSTSAGLELIRCEWNHTGAPVRQVACRDSFYVYDLTHIHLPPLDQLTCRGSAEPANAVSLLSIRCRSEGAN